LRGFLETEGIREAEAELTLGRKGIFSDMIHKTRWGMPNWLGLEAHAELHERGYNTNDWAEYFAPISAKLPDDLAALRDGLWAPVSQLSEALPRVLSSNPDCSEADYWDHMFRSRPIMAAARVILGGRSSLTFQGEARPKTCTRNGNAARYSIPEPSHALVALAAVACRYACGPSTFVSRNADFNYEVLYNTVLKKLEDNPDQAKILMTEWKCHVFDADEDDDDPPTA